MVLRNFYHIKRRWPGASRHGRAQPARTACGGASRFEAAAALGEASPLGYLTSRFWSPSVLWSIDLVIVLAGLRLGRHLLILRARRPATFQALGRAVAPNLDKQLEPD